MALIFSKGVLPSLRHEGGVKHEWRGSEGWWGGGGDKCHRCGQYWAEWRDGAVT